MIRIFRTPIPVSYTHLLITVVQETDWASFVQGIVDCIEAVDWIGLAGKIYTLLYSALGVAFGALAKFIGTLIADGFAAAKDYFNGKIEECGGDVWAGMLKGIVDAAKGVVSWICLLYTSFLLVILLQSFLVLIQWDTLYHPLPDIGRSGARSG